MVISSLFHAVLNRKRLILTGFFLAMVYLVLHWLEYFVHIRYADFGILGSSIALIFSLIGIWFGNQLARTPHPVPALTDPGLPKIRDLYSTNGPLSPREMEVLLLMAEGKSNQEIADGLFVSANTVKTHLARIYEKLEVKRRTEAVSKARKLGIFEKVNGTNTVIP